MDRSELAPSLRALLELDLRRLADEGHIPSTGERRVTFALDENGRIRWFEPLRVRVAASELEPGAGVKYNPARKPPAPAP